MRIFSSLFIILMGFSCFCAQILFIREFLIQFYGNELIIGLILANWLFLEALGSFTFGLFGSKIKYPHILYAIIQLLAGISLPLNIIAVRSVKILFGIIPGEGTGIAFTFLSSFLIMSFSGFLLGGQFPLVCRLYADLRKKPLSTAVGTSYFLEAIGFGFAGVFITYGLIPNISTLQIAFIIGWLNIACSYLFFTLKIRPKLKILRIGIFCLLILAGIFVYSKPLKQLNENSLKWQWHNFNLVGSKNSVYGNVSVTKQHEQYVFYYDGLPFMTVPDPDIAFVNDLVNFPFLSAEKCSRIAVIGCGIGGVIDTILRFPVEKVSYAEMDPLVIRMAKDYATDLTIKELNDPRLEIHYIDGRLFLKQCNDNFDIILSNLPLPTTLFINRFYTKEFFEIVRERLTPQGILCLSIPGSLSYLSEEQSDINQCLLKTLRAVFPSVEVVPGSYNLFIASKSNTLALNPSSISVRLGKIRDKNAFLNESYFNYRLSPDYKNWFHTSLKKSRSYLNEDLKPIGVFYSLGLWNSLFSPEFQKIFRLLKQTKPNILLGLIVLFPIAIYCIFYILIRRKNNRDKIRPLIPAIILTSGFSGTSLNLIALLVLQTFYGYVYLHIGLLISAFMVGLALSGMLMTKKLKTIKKNLSTFLYIDLVFILFCFMFYPLIFFMQKLSADNIASGTFLIIFACVCALWGIFAGLEFPLANKIYLEQKNNGKNPGNILYAVDMLGAFCGAILVCLIIIPLAGIPSAILVIAFLKTSSFILLAASFFFSEHSYL
ncbi:MAG: fused MFS/spermidine synthase [Candidatus Omnitrophica bacterium]|nr:fused MFS/spermidine synthase [Candidatus Omnitrophota bacterium]